MRKSKGEEEASARFARLVEGHFPPYEDVLPKAHDKKLVLPRDPFLAALRRAALLGTKDSQAVRFRFAREPVRNTRPHRGGWSLVGRQSQLRQRQSRQLLLPWRNHPKLVDGDLLDPIRGLQCGDGREQTGIVGLER